MKFVLNTALGAVQNVVLAALLTGRIRKFFAAVVLAGIAGVSLAGNPATAQSEQDQIRAQVDAAEARVAEAASRVEAAQLLVDEAEERVLAVQARSDEASAEYGVFYADLHVVEHEIEHGEEQVAEAEQRRDALRDRVAEFTVGRYINSGQAPTLFTNENAAEQIFLDALAEYVSQENLDVVDDYREVLDDLEIRQTQLDDLLAWQAERTKEAEATAQKWFEAFEDLSDETAALEERRNTQARNLASLEAEVAALNAELDRLIDEERRKKAAEAAERARQLLAEQRARERARTEGLRSEQFGVVRSGPDWVCPVAGYFTHYKDWRAPRAYGGWHKGNDLFGATGTPLVSTEDGWVVHRYNRVGGNSVHITADSGNYYYYTHLDGYATQGPPEGHWLPAGTLVGYLGNTGNARTTPPHLHFEFHRGGKGNYVDPYPYIRRNCFGEA